MRRLWDNMTGGGGSGSDPSRAAAPPTPHEFAPPLQVDPEQAALEQALAESAAMAENTARASVPPPLISTPLPLQNLAAEYSSGSRADLYSAKARHLEQRYAAIRRVRGDGNCFYRGFHVSWMERLLHLPARAQAEAWSRLVPAASAQYADALPEGPLRAELTSLGEGFAARTRALCEAVGAAAGAAEAELLRAVSDEAAMEASLRWLRLLASAYMRTHRETFEPVCADGTRSFDAFLAAEVETMGVEADEMQVQALTAALQLRVRVEYLDAAPAPWSDRCGTHRFLVCGPPTRTGPAAAAEEGTMLVACLLYRPGHYDVLSPRDWEAMDDGAEPRAALVPPLPPEHRPAPPDDACAACGQALLGCWLCGQWVCRGPDGRCARFGLPSAGADRAGDAAPPPRGASGGLSRSLLHPLPESFGLKPGQTGAVCPSCLDRCPAAATLLADAGAPYCADGFTLLHCVCGHLEFAPAMLVHLRACSFEKARAASQHAPDALAPPLSNAGSGRVGGGSSDGAGPSGAPPPYVATPFVVRAPSSASDDDPMAGGGMSVDDRLVAGMEQPADTDAHDRGWVHVTHEGAAPSTGTAAAVGPLKSDGTPDMRYRANREAAGSEYSAHRSVPAHEPRRPQPQASAAQPPGAPAAPSTDALVDILMALGLGVERADAEDILRFTGGDVDAAAAQLFAANDAEEGARRAKMLEKQQRAEQARRDMEETERRIAAERQRRQEEDRLRREEAEQRMAEDRRRWAEEDRQREAERQRQREAERQRHEATMQRYQEEAARRRDASLLSVRESEARLAEARRQEEQDRSVRDLRARPREAADHLIRTFNCRAVDADRAVAAAIKTNGDINEAAILLTEPEEMEMILAYETTQEKYTCFHCGRRFRTFAAYQRHSSARLSAGTCQQAVQRPARSPPRERPGQTGEEEHFLGKAGRAVQEAWQGVGDGIKDGARGLADSVSNFIARDPRGRPGMITTECPYPHCRRSQQVPEPRSRHDVFTCVYCYGKFTVN